MSVERVGFVPATGREGTVNPNAAARSTTFTDVACVATSARAARRSARASTTAPMKGSLCPDQPDDGSDQCPVSLA